MIHFNFLKYFFHKWVLKHLYSSFVIVLVLVFNVQCIQQKSHFASLSSNNVVQDRMYIKFDQGYYEQNGETAPLHQLSSVEDLLSLADCGLNKGEDSIEDIYCILDLNEADIVLSQAGIEGLSGGIPLEINVPTEMCEYTQWMIPWHWNQKSGYGPRVIEQCNVIANNSIPGSVGVTCVRVRTGTTTTNWVLQTEESNSPCEEGGLEGFDYDFSSTDGLANCCFGKAKEYTVEAQEPGTNGCNGCGCCTGPAINEDVSSSEEWGGDIKSCIGGPIRGSNWDSYTDIPFEQNIEGEIFTTYLEVPVSDLAATWQNGMRRHFSVGPAFSEVIHPTSITVANYFDGIEDFLFTSSGCSNCPDLFYADSSKSATTGDTSFPIGYPYFSLSCLDSNYEVLHRVHLIIREWNTLEEFLNFQDSEGRSGDPDIEGNEGDECLYYEPDEQIGNSRCNDFSDIDDIGSYPEILYGS